MLLKYLATTILILSAAVNLSDAQRCSRIAVRKEIRDLSSRERQAFLRAMRAVGQGRRPNIYNQLATVHVRNQNTIHGYPVFLIWHRTFIRFLEQQMQRYDRSVALHYWDWTKDARNPERSEILSTRLFGGSTRGECLNTANFPNWQAYNPRPHCLARIYVSGHTPGPFYPRAITDEIRYQSRTYDYYRIRLEGGPHAAPHNGCGGDLASMQSPEDPLFFVHHSFIDKLYDEWQRDDWRRRRTMYDGVNYNGRRASLNDELAGLGYTVGEAIDIGSLCYRYQDTGRPRDMGRVGDLPIMLALPPEEAARRQRQQQQQGRQQVNDWEDDWEDDDWEDDDWEDDWGLVRRSYAMVREDAYGGEAPAKDTYPAKPKVSAKPIHKLEHPKSAPVHNSYGARPERDNERRARPERDDAYRARPERDNGHRARPERDNGHRARPERDNGHRARPERDEDCDDEPEKKVKHVVRKPKGNDDRKAAKKAKPAYVAKPVRHTMREEPDHHRRPRDHKDSKDNKHHKKTEMDIECEKEVEATIEYEYAPKKTRGPHPAAVQLVMDIPEERIRRHAEDYDEVMVHPRPVDERWLRMNNIDVATQRELEHSYCGIIDKVNVVIEERCTGDY